MSAKYRRVRQADEALPAPLRWLTRAFSSITLSVVLLSIVCVYGLFASVPLKLLWLGFAYLVVFAGTVGVVAAGAVWFYRRATAMHWAARAGIGGAAVGGAVFPAVAACRGVFEWTAAHPGFVIHRATVLYRLPVFEMTELEFYAWWPLRLVLILFVINMVWATIRRIEFKFVNLGVLTVHTGIVVIALGTIFYGRYKVEGDTILWRRDLGGGFERVFYDATTPAVYLQVDDGPEVMIPTPELPRYNDYTPGELDLRLHERGGFAEAMAPGLRVTIPGFYAYASAQTVWRDAGSLPPGVAVDPGSPRSPAIRLVLGDASGPAADPALEAMLLADVPARRVLEQPGLAIEYLVSPGEARRADLTAAFDGEHGLVVEVPGVGVRRVYAIAPGQTITVADTGYRLTVEEVGPYGLPFVTEGYRGASDTRAVVRVETPGGEAFTRLAMHRYPERSQDFVPAPDDPSVGPMGRRQDPDDAIRLAYLDATKPQFHLVARGTNDPEPLLIARLPGMAPLTGRLTEPRFPVGSVGGQARWMHITERIAQAVEVTEPAVVPKAQRDPKNEGTYIESLLPVRVELDPAVAPGGEPWSRLVWLRHMRYPKYPDAIHRPAEVDVPGVGRLRIAFSRQRHTLPFAVALDAFEMQPYPGSNIPRDFVADLRVAPVNADGAMTEPPDTVTAHMNNPVVIASDHAPVGLRRVKLSQTGWDPPQPDDPTAMARDESGRFLNQQRFTILGVGNNVGIRVIFVGACLVAVGIPWAFYVKPWLLRRQKRRIQEQLRDGTYTPPRRAPDGAPGHTAPEPAPEPQTVGA